MRFRPTARRSHTQATLTKSRRRARTTKFSSCRLAEVPQRKFPPVPALTRHRSIRRTENISPGVRKPAPASKPINGGCSCKIDNPGKPRMSRRILILPWEASIGHRIRVRLFSPLKSRAATGFSGLPQQRSPGLEASRVATHGVRTIWFVGTVEFGFPKRRFVRQRR